jgi:hypothetical protein
MKTTTRLFGALSILMLFFMTSCASTKITGEWKDPNMTAKQFKNIMVIGVAKQPRDRRAYEDEFVRQLKAKGVMAVASRTLIPHDKMRDKATIEHAVKGVGFDGVIITRVGDIKSRERDYYRTNMYDYYNSSFAITPYYRVGSSNQQKYGFESNLYDATTEKLVFSLSSDTYAQDNINKRLGSYIKTVVNKLRQNNLL